MFPRDLFLSPLNSLPSHHLQNNGTRVVTSRKNDLKNGLYLQKFGPWVLSLEVDSVSVSVSSSPVDGESHSVYVIPLYWKTYIEKVRKRSTKLPDPVPSGCTSRSPILTALSLLWLSSTLNCVLLTVPDSSDDVRPGGDINTKSSVLWGVPPTDLSSYDRSAVLDGVYGHQDVRSPTVHDLVSGRHGEGTL